MQRLIIITFSLLTALIPLIFTTSTYELFEFPKFLVLLSGTIIISVTWLTHAIGTRDWSLRSTAAPRTLRLIDWAVLAILATQTITTLTSIHPYTSFWGYYSRFHQGLLTTICYTILYFAAVKWLDKKSVQKITNISIKTSIIIGLIAILEHYNLSLTCLIMTTLSKLQNLQTNFVANTSCWGGLTNPLDRSFATLGQPNWLAAYLIPNLFFLLYTLRLRTGKLPLAPFLSLFLIFTALLVTNSRSGFIALALSLITYYLLTFRSTSLAKFKRELLLLVTGFVLLSALLGTPFTPKLLSFFQQSKAASSPTPIASGTALETVGGTASGDIRKIVWSGALKLITLHPWLGTGPETFAYTYYWVRPTAHNYTSEWDYLYNKAHNEYLNLAATTGLVGLSAYLLWHYALIALSFRKTPRSNLLPVIAASAVAFTVTNFFGFSVIPVYFLLVLISAFPSAADNTAPEENLAPHYYWLGAAVIVLLLLLPSRLFLADLYFVKGKAYLDAGKAAEAVTFLAQAVAIRPQEDLFRSVLGEAYSASANPSTQTLAVREAELTRTHNPYHLNYYKSRAKIYLALAATDPVYYRAAAEEIAQARELSPTDPKLAYNLGLIYSRLGDIAKTEEQMKEAIELKKNYQDPYYALTLIYEQTKQETKIPDLLQTARENLATYSGLLKEKMDKYQPIN